MGAKIIFLGTGGDALVVGKQLRASGGFILQINENQFHIDPGPGALVRAAQYDVNLRENTAVLVSHAHVNHCNDVNAVINAMTHAGLDKFGVLIGNKTVINGNAEEKPILTEFHKKCVEKVIAMEYGQKIGIDNVEIKALYARHSDMDTIGFKFITPEFTLSYTSDTEFSNDLAKFHEDSDIMVINVVYPSDIKEKYNLNSEDALKLINKVQPKLAILQHFGIKMLSVNPLHEARELQKRTKTQIMAAKDGLSLDLMPYLRKPSQKKLTQF
jgi:ribonuclease BN (tRNA processing enzyme)